MDTQLTSSVIMATYNGMKYIEQQLDSIRLQTRKPNEVIICDDVSQDGTFDFLNMYIKEHSLDNWKVIRNDINLGWINNFYKLFQLASSDIVFCADQDDIWSINKIDLMTSIMENDNSVIVLGGEVIKFTAPNNPIKTINIKEKGFDKYSTRKILFNENFYITHRPGCATCFRKSLLPYVNEMKFSEYPHDKLVWNLGVLFDGAYIVDKVVIYQRRHSESAMVIKKKENKRLEGMLITHKNLQWFKCKTEKYFINDINKNRFIENSLKFFKYRIHLMKDKDIKMAFKLLFLLKYYPRKRSYFADLKYLCDRIIKTM